LSKRARRKVLLSEGHPLFTATVTSRATNRRFRFIPSLLDYTTEPGSVKASSRQDARGIRGNHHPSVYPVIDMDVSLHHTCQPEKCTHCSNLPKSISPPGDRLYGLHYVCSRALGNTSSCCTAHDPAFQEFARHSGY
jgi:hypothetical protein